VLIGTSDVLSSVKNIRCFIELVTKKIL
jgi:hypothetical protein